MLGHCKIDVFRGMLLLGIVFWWCSPDAPSAEVSPQLPVAMPFLEETGARDRLVSMDFNQVDIRVFIKAIGQMTGVNFLVDDRIQGTVTLISPSQIRMGEVWGVFESVLQTKGYAAVPSGTLVKIMPRAEGTRANLPVRIGSDPEAIPVDDSLATQVIPVRYADITQVSAVVTSLISTAGQVVTFPETGTIIVTDTSSSIHRAARIVRELDIEGKQDVMEVVPLKYASATKISDQVTQIVQRAAAPTGLRRSSAPGQDASGQIRILPDERTNSVVIVASPVDMDMARGIIAKLDVDRPLEASNIHVIYLEHAEATEIEQAVSTTFGRITGATSNERNEPFQVTSDESTNALIIVCAPQDYQFVEEMIKKLDVVREQVLVEFQIVEASDNVLQELGFDWATLDEAMADSIRGFAYTNLGPRVEAATGDLEGVGVGLWKEIDGVPEIGAILQALEQNSGVNILSTPHVLTSNHQEATITVADNVPYVSQSRVTEYDPATPTAIRTFDFKDVGIVLSVRPHVSASDLVRLEIEATFSKLIQGTTGLGSETPTTAKREVSTIISVASGSTVVIGGLMRDDRERVVSKVPLLGDLPLLGALFRSEREQLQKTNLLLFITPRALVDAESLAEMTEGRRQQQRDYEQSSPRR